MDNIIAIEVSEESMRPHELIVVTEIQPDFLPRATLARFDGRMALLYSREGLTPLARFGAGPGNIVGLGELFSLLTGYIRCLIEARDMLLDTRLLSSDPEMGVFAVESRTISPGRGPMQGLPGTQIRTDVTNTSPGRGPKQGLAAKTIWGSDALTDEREKICRVAQALGGHERVMGAVASMERFSGLVRSGTLSLKGCLKTAESVYREWNHITTSG